MASKAQQQILMNARHLIKIRREQWEQYHDIEMDSDFVRAVADKLVDPEIVGLRNEVTNNPEYLIELCMVIVDKDRQTVPFFLNEVQKEFIADLNQAIADFKAGKRLTIAFLVLKGRQQGFTSVITAYQACCSILRRNFAGYTLADDGDNTEAIFQDKCKFPYDQLPDKIKPHEKYNNRRELLFDKLNSVWRVATAGKKGVGRSKTLNFFHGSEAAFWDDIINMLASLGQALTKSCIKILESTANGINQFKDLWDEENEWEPKFYAWWRTPEYFLNFESDLKEQEFKNNVGNATKKDKNGKTWEDTKKEWAFSRCKSLQEEHGLSWEQLYWYYHKWVELKAVVKQEYPCFAEEAFLASGRCVFDKEIVAARINELKEYYKENPYRVGRMEYKWHDAETQDYILDDTIKFVDDPLGWIRIYEEPKEGWPFVLGGDTKGEGKDFYTGTCINNVTGNRCATVEMQLNHSKPYTWQMYCLGRYYNNALIGIEMNWNTAPIEELERLHYPTQYVRKKYDKMGTVTDTKFGWKTDGNTRPVIIDKAVDNVEDNIELYNDIPTLLQMLTFVYDEDNRPDAESGKHDDLLFGDMIGDEIRWQQTVRVIEIEPEKPDIRKYKDELAKLNTRHRRRLS